MKTIVTALWIVLIGFVFVQPTSVSAQDTDFWNSTIVRVPLTAQIVNNGLNNVGGLGYKLGPEFGAGVEVEKSYLSAFTQVTVGFRHKNETGDGHEFGLTQHVCGHVRHWLGCGGFAYAYTATSRWTKGAVRPIVGGGWEYEQDVWFIRVLVDYEVGALDSSNGLHGEDVEVRLGNPMFFWIGSFSLCRFHQSGAPNISDSGWEASTGLGFDPVVWKKKRK